MSIATKHSGALALRLIVGLALLGWPRVGSAQGTWSVISLPYQPGEVVSASAMAVDATGNLYVADLAGYPFLARIQKRDAQGNWSVIATYGSGVGQVRSVSSLAADAAGNLYVADYSNGSRIQKRDAHGDWSVLDTNHTGILAVDAAGNLYSTGNGIQKRDAQGNWSVIATSGSAIGQVAAAYGFAADGAGNLYVADRYSDNARTWSDRIQKRDAQGNWSVIANSGAPLGQVGGLSALVVDSAGNLYVADAPYFDGQYHARIQKRDARGDWSVIALAGAVVGQVMNPTALAVDAAGNLYVGEVSFQDYSTGNFQGVDRIQRRDAQGNWSVLAADGWEPGKVLGPYALAVDTTGNLYIADHRGILQKRDAQGNWSLFDADHSGDLAVDTAGNLYVTWNGGPGHNNGIQKRNAQGTWSFIAVPGLFQEDVPSAVAVDTAGNLYVAGTDLYFGGSWVDKRDSQGNWSEIERVEAGVFALAADTAGNVYIAGVGNSAHPWIDRWDAQGSKSRVADGVGWAVALAVDTGGSLYLANRTPDQLQKRDPQGTWSVIAGEGGALGQVLYPTALAVDGAGNLYVADPENNRVLKYTPAP